MTTDPPPPADTEPPPPLNRKEVRRLALRLRKDSKKRAKPGPVRDARKKQ